MDKCTGLESRIKLGRMGERLKPTVLNPAPKFGEVAEWLKATVLKTVVDNLSTVSSNLTLSVYFWCGTNPPVSVRTSNQEI